MSTTFPRDVAEWCDNCRGRDCGDSVTYDANRAICYYSMYYGAITLLYCAIIIQKIGESLISDLMVGELLPGGIYDES